MRARTPLPQRPKQILQQEGRALLARPFSFFYNLLAEIVQNEFDCTERIDLRY